MLRRRRPGQAKKIRSLSRLPISGFFSVMRHRNYLQSIRSNSINDEEWKTAKKAVTSSVQVGGPAIRRLDDLSKGGLQGLPKPVGGTSAAAKIPPISLSSFSNCGGVKVKFGRDHRNHRRSSAAPWTRES